MTDVAIASGDTEIDAHLAVPTGTGPWPGIVVVHDILGFRGDVRAQADRLAGHGYVVAAPRLYSRGSKPGCLVRTIRTVLSGQGPAFGDLDATRAWLAARSDCTGQVGILGFCIGGDFAMLCAPRYDFAAASVNYGSVPKDAETALAGSCPVVGSWGAHDPRLKGSAARAQAGRPRRTERHPGVPERRAQLPQRPAAGLPREVQPAGHGDGGQPRRPGGRRGRLAADPRVLRRARPRAGLSCDCRGHGSVRPGSPASRR